MEDDGADVNPFERLGVCKQLVEACEKMGWRNPTSIQSKAIPLALQGKDLVGLAQTGTGKTGAFAIPILQALLENPKPLFACVLSPTRELASQISELFEALGSCAGIKCAIVGGVDMMSQAISLANRPHILVGTPGRLLDHLNNTSGFSLRTLKYLVLDEADSLLNMEFEKDINEILKVIPWQRKTYLFSATMTNKVRNLQRACLKNPVKIETSSKYSTVSTLKEHFRLVPAKHKDCFLVHILTETSYTMSMVFTRTRKATRLLALFLKNLGLNAIPVSGQMSQVYIHRVGRTARAGRSGVAISLVNEFEVEWFLRIEKLIGKKLPEFHCPKKEVLLLLERVSEAKKISLMRLKETENKKRKEDVEDSEEAEELMNLNV